MCDGTPGRWFDSRTLGKRGAQHSAELLEPRDAVRRDPAGETDQAAGASGAPATKRSTIGPERRDVAREIDMVRSTRSPTLRAPEADDVAGSPHGVRREDARSWQDPNVRWPGSVCRSKIDAGFEEAQGASEPTSSEASYGLRRRGLDVGSRDLAQQLGEARSISAAPGEPVRMAAPESAS